MNYIAKIQLICYLLISKAFSTFIKLQNDTLQSENEYDKNFHSKILKL